ncbi:hypothetical protein R4Z10_02000 [Niallia sp. XMNu-256]|uniref:hypothetical protein n=1 Tax=Niallia sp. XMNu-256 TaxID=3082444 RepID=UPI0030CBA49E
MVNQINGLKDIYKLLVNERKIGGAIEAESLRLRTGEVYKHAVITHVDLLGSAIYSLGFVTEDQENMIINISELSLLQKPKFKRICEMNNQAYKLVKTKEKLKYLKRLCDINLGSSNVIFLEEAKLIIEDIGFAAVSSEIDTNLIFPKDNVYSIA